MRYLLYTFKMKKKKSQNIYDVKNRIRIFFPWITYFIKKKWMVIMFLEGSLIHSNWDPCLQCQNKEKSNIIFL